MKASEMTNDELASAIERRVSESASNWDFAPTLREAAARLRKMDGVNATLKVAEDALVVCRDGMCGECHRQHPGETCVCPNGCYEMSMAKNAIAAIRADGGTKK